MEVNPKPKEQIKEESYHGSYDMKDQAEKCVERHCELAHEFAGHLSKVSTSGLDSHQFTKDYFVTVGLADVWAQVVQTHTCTSHESGDPTNQVQSTYWPEMS